MRHVVFRPFAALVVSVAVATLHAQPARPAVERTRQVYVSVLDKKGAPVTDVAPADFVVREDGKPREVISVRPAEDPMHIALLVDDSQAGMDATSHLREGLAALLERLHGKASIALMTFGERPTLIAPYTQDTEQIKQRAARIFPRQGAGAYLLDAIVDASRGLAQRQADRPIILVVVFEGVEFSNRHYQQVLDELMKSGASLHVVAIGTPSSSMEDEMRNRNIVIADGTQRTGGRRDQVLAVSGIPDKLKQVADELTNQLILTYGRPDTLVPAEKLEVTSARRDLTVRARTRLITR